jgi:hypothetical protein
MLEFPDPNTVTGDIVLPPPLSRDASALEVIVGAECVNDCETVGT